MEHCIKYALTAEEVALILRDSIPNPAKVTSILNGPRWEVWQGIPRPYGFSEIPCKNGKTGLLAAPKGVYIWVTPEACEALDEAPDEDDVVLMVYCDEDPEKRRRCDIWTADMEGNDLNRAIARAKQLNADIITKPK